MRSDFAGLLTLAVLILSAAICLVLGSNVVDVQRANAILAEAGKQQAATFIASHKSEDQLNALARGLQQLANHGDANASTIIDTLQRNGIRINAGAGNPKM